MKIASFDKTNIKPFHVELNAALKKFADEHGIVFHGAQDAGRVA